MICLLICLIRLQLVKRLVNRVGKVHILRIKKVIKHKKLQLWVWICQVVEDVKDDIPSEADPSEADPSEADPSEADPSEADPSEDTNKVNIYIKTIYYINSNNGYY